MKRAAGSPRLARWLLERALPADVRDDVSGDLEEIFQRRCATAGVVLAWLWYWRQAMAFSGRFLAERLRDRRGRINETGGAKRPGERRMSSAFSWMDLKLAVRMLARYPGLTIVGVFGMAVGIAIAAGAFSIMNALTNPALPLDGGDRVVTLHYLDARTTNPERRIMHDFVAWRDEMQAVEDLGAFRQMGLNLIAPGGQPETVRVAAMSAAGFRVARVPPLLGRHLVEDDEREAAPPVAVIGYDVWRARFSGDPAIVGRPIQLAETTYTVVGVMPEGFAFPIRHRFWIPLKTNPSRYDRLEGPTLTTFARLAPGVTREAAHAEMSTIARRTAATYPKIYEHLRPQVLPYTYPFFDIDDPAVAWQFRAFVILVSLLLVVVCVNVAILVYARTASRHAEIAVRTALGASRRRIIGQLFAESLVLSAAAAVIGLLLTSIGLKQANAAMAQGFEQQLPFWWIFEISSGTVLYGVVLTFLSAAIVGVVPALKATGRRVQAGLQAISSGGGSGMRLGKMWTVLIVGQVAFAVAILPMVVYNAWDSLRAGTASPGPAAEKFLTAMLVMDQSTAPATRNAPSQRELDLRFKAHHDELMRRLSAEPGVSDVTFAANVPGEEATVWIEAEGLANPEPTGPDGGGFAVRAGSKDGHEVRFGRVDVNYFQAFDVSLLMGRGFQAGDAAATDPRRPSGAAANAVIVNRSFVDRILGGGNALGRRIRYVGATWQPGQDEIRLGPWYEIVGVVGDFPEKATESRLVDAKLYHAVAVGGLHPVTLAFRMHGTNPATYAGRLREIAAGIDPTLQLRNVMTLDGVLRKAQRMLRLLAVGLAVLTLSVVVLTAAGIYALMSFTVAGRRKEIGIRAALGADPRHILASIFSRAFAQLAIGAVVGALIAVWLEQLTDGEMLQGHEAVVLPIVAALMTAVGLVATLGPARRGLRVNPTEALRDQ